MLGLSFKTTAFINSRNIDCPANSLWAQIIKIIFYERFFSYRIKCQHWPTDHKQWHRHNDEEITRNLQTREMPICLEKTMVCCAIQINCAPFHFCWINCAHRNQFQCLNYQVHAGSWRCGRSLGFLFCMPTHAIRHVSCFPVQVNIMKHCEWHANIDFNG